MLAWSMWEMSTLSLDADSWPLLKSGFVQGVGLGFVTVPLNAIAFGLLADILQVRRDPSLRRS